MKITLNKAATDALLAMARNGVKQLEEAASMLERTANEVKSATEQNRKVAKASLRVYRMWSALSWASLFRRFTGG